jgi:flagellar hook protein FlgE
MYSGISGMKVNQTKLDVIGNNIANVGTTSFKSSSARFKDMLYQNAGEATSPTTTKGGTNAKQVGLGAQLSSINKMMGQGNALSTGRSLDVCVDGDGYLMTGSGPVDYTAGATTGAGNPVDTTTKGLSAGGSLDVLYTRDGNLTLDYQGNLLTSDGRRVMGYLLQSATNGATTGGTASGPSLTTTGTPPVTTAQYVNADATDLTAVGTTYNTAGGTPTLQALMIPDKVSVPANATAGTAASEQSVKKFEIGKNGVITAILGDGSRTALGQIAMASFKNPEGLTSVGGNLLQKSSNSGAEIIKTPLGEVAATDNSKGFGDFIQGALEGSNVDLTEQFTDMITATRSFQAAGKMITTGDEILQTITGLMR